MMATIQRLIDQLNEVEDKEQPLVFQYYLKEHFDYLLEDQDQTVADKAWDLACERTMSDDDWYNMDVVSSNVLDSIKQATQ